jgi:hypothetical protein
MSGRFPSLSTTLSAISQVAASLNWPIAIWYGEELTA